MQEQPNLDFYEKSLQYHNNDIAQNALGTAASLASSYAGKGNALMGLGIYDEALEAFKEATRLYPDDKLYYSWQASAMQKLGKNEEIIEIINKKIELFPPAYESDYVDIGNAWKTLGRIEKALEAYTEATELNPESAYVYSNKGDALQAFGKSEEALEAYTEAIRLEPNNASYHYMQGLIFLSLNREEDASYSFSQAVTLHPQYLNHLQALGCEIVMGDVETSSDSDVG